MENTTKKRQNYRHTPAFILLFLAGEDLYGAALLDHLNHKLPYYKTDSAVIYRTLQELEKDGFVRSYWETDTSGPAKKWYGITDAGYGELARFKDDIVKRKENFDYFIQIYQNLDFPQG